MSMSKRHVAALSCISLFLVSFGGPRPSDSDTAVFALPAVSAPHPDLDTSRSPAIVDPAVRDAVAYFHAHASRMTDDEIEQVATAVVDIAGRYELDPQLVMAVIHIESRGNRFALSNVGAMGLMQIMPATGEELADELGLHWPGVHVLFDPIVNIEMGIAYLRRLERRYGSLATALAAYNWGPGHIDRRLRRGVALPAVYSQSVLAAHRDLI